MKLKTQVILEKNWKEKKSKKNLDSTNDNQFPRTKKGKNIGAEDRREVSGTKGEKGVILIDVHQNDYHLLELDMTENEVENEVEEEEEG